MPLKGTVKEVFFSRPFGLHRPSKDPPLVFTFFKAPFDLRVYLKIFGDCLICIG
jgi:hypothetical protein